MKKLSLVAGGIRTAFRHLARKPASLMLVALLVPRIPNAVQEAYMPNGLPRVLTALPVYNEAKYVDEVLTAVKVHAGDVLVVNDGSTDGTTERLALRSDVSTVTHPRNRGYGAALRTVFEYAIAHDYEILVTIDCDGQHEPRLISQIAQSCQGFDMVSGSRYLGLPEESAGAAPRDRRFINRTITRELNNQFGLDITDAFCGFKAYRVAALRGLELTETGYAMPLELWVQAAHLGWRISEVAVPLIYLDASRSFGGALDDAETRLSHYREVIERASRTVALRLAATLWVGNACPAGIHQC